MKTLERLACGALAGLAGTIVIQYVESALHRVAPDAMAPVRGDPGEYFVQSAEHALPPPLRQRVPESARNVAAQSMGYLYGATFGAIFALVRPHARSIVKEGALLGIACWAAGFLGWLPSTRMMKPIWRQKPKQIAGPIATHAIFGVATVGANELLERAIA